MGIVMNPPFSKGQDIKHVMHARRFLRADGLLIAIVSAGSRTEAALQPLADSWDEIPADTFKESGTGVRTILATFSAQ